jgi:DNA-directed RNA polymerase specialized sigma24 family protein
MNDIYIKISKLYDRFRKIAGRNTKDVNEIDESVQELYLYFLQMSPDLLKKIYTNDGETGVIKFGTIILNRSLTSKTSPYYYKYKKYYSHIDSTCFVTTKTANLHYSQDNYYNNKDVENIPEIESKGMWKQLEDIDKILDNCHWYDKKMFELYYYEQNTLDSLASKTKISRNSIYTTIDKVRTIIKDKIHEKEKEEH